jgi:integrase
MPLKLIAPRPGKSPFYSVRGTHLGVYLDRSTKATERAVAAKLLRAWKEDIERGAVTRPGEPTFLDATVQYIQSGGDAQFLEKVSEHFGRTPLRLIDQQRIDSGAVSIYPQASAATRNRQFYTPVSAVLKHAGIDWKIRRPKGWRGKQRTDWMKPEQAFRLCNAAWDVDPEFGIFLMMLLYTGGRLSETCSLTCDKLHLNESFAYIGMTKNGNPRPVHIPPALVAALANHPRGLARVTGLRQKPAKIFRFTKCGRIYTLLSRAKKAAGVDLDFVTFHIFRHTWATWMRRYAGLDTTALLATETWKDPASVRRYEHVVASEESMKADLLPVEKTWKRLGNG